MFSGTMPSSSGKLSNTAYVGRFAPSPSGDLHFGSLVTALASYLRARQQNGTWLLRLDDIDTTRCKPEFVSSILRSLEHHGLYWDDSPIYQSQRLSVYNDALSWLHDKDLTYFCQCTRKQIKAKGPLYNGTCRHLHLFPDSMGQSVPTSGSDFMGKSDVTDQPLAIRLKNPATQQPLTDILSGQVDIPVEVLHEDFVLQRRDGLYAYHLASVVDDIEHGITEVVRGADLLLPSACQAVLYGIFASSLPDFLHIPVAISEPGRKLSKQNRSPALDNRHAINNLAAASHYLGANTPKNIHFVAPEALLNWLIQHWNWQQISPRAEKIVESRWC